MTHNNTWRTQKNKTKQFDVEEQDEIVFFRFALSVFDTVDRLLDFTIKSILT